MTDLRHPTPEERDASVSTSSNPDERDLAGKDPLAVLRAALAISPEDAKQVREDAAVKAEKQKSPPK